MVTSLAIVLAILVAIALATDARASRREAVAEAEAPPIGQLLQVNGHRVHALVRGDGPDLVLLHGASGNLRDFLPLIERLAPRYRVIAFDRPGLGWSDAIPDGISLKGQALQLAAAAHQLGVKDPIVLGQSFGGSVALAWALHAPLRPRALVGVSVPSMPWIGALDIWYRLNASRLGRIIAAPLAAAFVPDSHVATILEDVFRPGPVPEGYGRNNGATLAMRRVALRVNADQVNRLLADLKVMVTLYAGLLMPVELVHGTADHIVPLAIHSRPLFPLLPDATLTEVEGAGHMPHHSHPDLILAAIDRAANRAGLR